MWLSTLITCPSGVAGEEAANVPRLEGQRAGNLRARLDRCRVAGVRVIHLNRDIGGDRGGGVVGHEAALGTRPSGIGQGDDPAVGPLPAAVPVRRRRNPWPPPATYC